MKIECTIPVYNEERLLEQSIRSVVAFLRRERYEFKLIIADNGSTDSTGAIGASLAEEMPEVSLLSIPLKGRGRALRESWLSATSDIVAYMDADLATDLKCFNELYRAIANEHAAIAIGSRLLSGSVVKRSVKRELVSRLYNRLVQTLLGSTIVDAQCGFKALRREVATSVLPQVKSDEWFFDTELLFVAARCGYCIKEVPVNWREGRDSKVKLFSTAAEDLCGIFRLRKQLCSVG